MKNSNHKKIIVTLCLLLVCASLSALNQNPLEDILFEAGMDDDGTGTAPIDGFLGVALAVGAYFGVRKLRKKDQ